MTRPEILQTLDKILSFRRLGEGWDGEEAAPISLEVSNIAFLIVLRAALEAFQRSIAWLPPTLVAGSDGQIDMTWRSGERRLLVIVKPQNGVVVVRQTARKPERSESHAGEAISAVLWALAP